MTFEATHKNYPRINTYQKYLLVVPFVKDIQKQEVRKNVSASQTEQRGTSLPGRPAVRPWETPASTNSGLEVVEAGP